MPSIFGNFDSYPHGSWYNILRLKESINEINFLIVRLIAIKILVAAEP